MLYGQDMIRPPQMPLVGERQFNRGKIRFISHGVSFALTLPPAV
jgi:hypothetical protein